MSLVIGVFPIFEQNFKPQFDHFFNAPRILWESRFFVQPQFSFRCLGPNWTEAGPRRNRPKCQQSRKRVSVSIQSFIRSEIRHHRHRRHHRQRHEGDRQLLGVEDEERVGGVDCHRTLKSFLSEDPQKWIRDFLRNRNKTENRSNDTKPENRNRTNETKRTEQRVQTSVSVFLSAFVTSYRRSEKVKNDLKHIIIIYCLVPFHINFGLHQKW